MFRLSHDKRVLLLALAGGLPAIIACVVLLATQGFPARIQWTIDIVVVLAWLAFCFAAHGHKFVTRLGGLGTSAGMCRIGGNLRAPPAGGR